MSYMFEAYCCAPGDQLQEGTLIHEMAQLGGHLDYREKAGTGLCLTFEFSDRELAERAMLHAQELGAYCEGPSCYGDD